MNNIKCHNILILITQSFDSPGLSSNIFTVCGFVVCLILLSSGVSDKKLLRSCEEISSSSSCVGDEDHSSALNGHDIQSLVITAQDLERVRVCVCVFTPHSH